jgi:hypothetical protein
MIGGDAALRATAVRPSADAKRSWRLGVVFASALFAVAWTLANGKVHHWDAINYHYYLGYSAVTDRFAQDFFAAGTPSYINPYAYVPLHLLDRSGMPGWLASALLAAGHGLMLWLTYEVTLVGCGRRGHHRCEAFALLALALAALSPVYLQGVGLTLVDIPVGTITLAGWLALARAVRSGDLRWVAAGAALCGLAAGLKLSNALYAAAALSMMAFVPGGLRAKLRAGLVYAAACGAAFVAISAPWSVRLWETFGNPLFPFLNHWFASPDFISAPLHYERFRPATLIEFLTRPLDMLSPLSRQHTEGRAPDLRYAAAFALVAAWIAVAARSGRGKAAAIGEDDRVLAALATAFAIAWCLWLTASGNSRYFLPMGCIAAALIALVLERLQRRWKDGATVIAVVVVLGQGVQIAVASDFLRHGSAWHGPLLRLEYPDRFRVEPYLFLSTSFLSGSVFLPHWHRDSSMITTAGFYPLGPGYPGWSRASRLIERNADRLRIIRVLPRGIDTIAQLPGPATDLDNDVRRFGLRVDASDCEIVRVQSDLIDTRIQDDASPGWSTFLTCRLMAAPERAERYRAEVKPVDAVFDRVEDTCPGLFHPARPVTEQLPNWVRLYNMGSEMQLWVAEGRVLYRSPLLGGEPIDIGTFEAWQQAPQPIDCSVRFKPVVIGGPR